MKSRSKIVIVIIFLVCVCMFATGCELENSAKGGSQEDTAAQMKVADDLASAQKTPTDINYSLERYNLIRRAYWVNGQREKANTLICGVDKPLGYIVLFAGNSVVGNFVVDGKVSSLNSFLTPSSIDSTYGNSSGGYTTVTKEIADVDGSYGENDQGIFFFTVDGKYIEWTGTYLYSDIPFVVNNPIVTYKEDKPNE